MLWNYQFKRLIVYSVQYGNIIFIDSPIIVPILIGIQVSKIFFKKRFSEGRIQSTALASIDILQYFEPCSLKIWAFLRSGKKIL